MERLSLVYGENTARLDALLGVGRSCDLVARNYRIGARRARIWVIDGYGADATLERMGAFWLSLPAEAVAAVSDMQAFADRFVSFPETNVTDAVEDLLTAVLLGKTLLLVEGLPGAALIDAKDYPSRGVSEPSDGKVLRGAHDGFVEAVVPNMALLRRRIRDPHLTLEGRKAGDCSHTDIVLCYLEGQAPPELLAHLRRSLDALDVHALSMAQESVAEAIRPGQWYNPFPKVRFTERPDAAAATVLEGGVVVLVDNSPSVMLLPTSVFGFVQEANDFYFPPLVGSYLRLIRMAVFVLSLFITPVWYLLTHVPGRMPEAVQFLAEPDPCALSLLWQLLAVEFLIDVLKLASLNTPDALSNSFSMLGALILGDFAVQAGWLSPQVLVYMAFVSVAGFAQPGYELGYAFKLLRLVLLAFSAWWDLIGFFAGLLAIVLLLVTCKPLAGPGYLYPLLPFNATALRRLLIREPIHRDNT